MAHFLMWMATFFSIATFWKFMGFFWSTRKDKDFLQVQREHCKRFCIDVPRLENWLSTMKASSKSKVLNKNQCVHLFSKLIEAMNEIDKILSSATEDLKFQSLYEELCYLQKKVEIVGYQCIEQDQWCHSAVFQLHNKETFRELLIDLECCYNTACEMYLFCHPNQSNNIPPIEFDATTYEQVLEDGQVLKEKLEHVPQEEGSRDSKLAQHLLWRLKNLDRVDGGDLDDLEVPHDFQTPKLSKRIGKGGFGAVYKSNWLGLACATKVLEGDLRSLMTTRNEVGILAGLSHPNLVQFFGCGNTKNSDESPKDEGTGKMHLVMWLKKSSLFQRLKSLLQILGFAQKNVENPNEDESGKLHLVMELMETSLSKVLKKVKRPLPYHVAIDIMHQIAKGVCYLHDMQVAHLDLKPDNILSSSISLEDLDPCCIFKVTDYGTSQLEVCSNPKPPKDLKPLEGPIGTRGYMSPEMIKGSISPYRFQADVWSFAMISSEILTGKVPYSDLEKPKDFYDQIQGINGHHLRPDLPDNCEELTNLIRECWSQDPLQRPTFFEICDRLTSLKKSRLMGGSCATRDSHSIKKHVSKVDEPMALSKDVPIHLDLQLSKAKGLLKLHYIGIVGMGGIGKTTLAKAIFDDEKVRSSYQASYFVAECKNYQSSFEILCKIFPDLGKGEKPKNLGDAQELMRALLFGKKVLLILDDVKDKTQVHEIVPPDFIKAKKGTTIILTTRKWSTIESFVGIEGRLDVERLDEEGATRLFTTHLSWDATPLSPNFEDLLQRVVKACNGLPLSLKVMGSFLHNKKRLRSWERALRRLARGRKLEDNEEIWNTLRVSYDGLNNDVEKGLFLDVACFFCRDVYPSGVFKETILYMVAQGGVLPKYELERLIDMSLVEVNEDGILEMHDQLRDMGRRIAKRTRIWEASMIPYNGFSSEDAKVVEGICWQGTMVKRDPSVDFQNLRMLILATTCSNYEEFVKNLDFFSQFASQCSKLEVHILRQEWDFSALPKEVGSLSSLTTLDLRGSWRLKGLPEEVGNLSSLTTLLLRGCSSLEALPKKVGNLSSLTTLALRGCWNLKGLPKEVGNLSSLTTLDLRECHRLEALPKEVGNLSSLTTLDLRECEILEALPMEVGNLSFLTTLNLIGCRSLSGLPKEVGSLSALTTLDLRECWNLKALPKEVGNLSSLTNLDLSGCWRLEDLPEEVRNLSSLTTPNLRLCGSLVVSRYLNH